MRDKDEVLRKLRQIEARARRIAVLLRRKDIPIFQDKELGIVFFPDHVKAKVDKVIEREKSALAKDVDELIELMGE